MTTNVEVLVIGGGQAGLAAGYYLRRAGHRFVILDDQHSPGGAWPHMWPSLRLFSPADFASLPGWPMPRWPDGFPPARHVGDYLTGYEARYGLPIERPVRVQAVRRDGPALLVDTDRGQWRAHRVISATGTWQRPFRPSYPGAGLFAGRQLHTVDYRTPTEFTGADVVVVGGGNSAAQLVAEISTVAATTWVTNPSAAVPARWCRRPGLVRARLPPCGGLGCGPARSRWHRRPRGHRDGSGGPRCT
ncbi:putative oxidoreductase CzcO [Rhodococcus sp. B50]|nr:putative oxidoreductase CzcO [Rhodococcus sp. B50]